MEPGLYTCIFSQEELGDFCYFRNSPNSLCTITMGDVFYCLAVREGAGIAFEAITVVDLLDKHGRVVSIWIKYTTSRNKDFQDKSKYFVRIG